MDSFCHASFLVYNLLNILFLIFFPPSSGEKASDGPYQVNVTIPVEGFEPIQFILTKMCGTLALLSKVKTTLLVGFIDSATKFSAF